MVEHWSYGWAQAGQVVDHTDPDTVHLHPGDTKRHQDQEKKQGNAWAKAGKGESKKGG